MLIRVALEDDRDGNPRNVVMAYKPVAAAAAGIPPKPTPPPAPKTAEPPKATTPSWKSKK